MFRKPRKSAVSPIYYHYSMKLLRVLAVLASISVCTARHEPVVCGYHGENWREELQLHRQSQKHSKARPRAAQLNASIPDNGNIAILDENDGVVARRNSFNLGGKGVSLIPTVPKALKYRYETSDNAYDASAAASGALVQGIGDDDFRDLDLPFAFPFFGASYNRVSINSDGNLTFTKPDASSADRSLGRMTAGPPRLAPLFVDLDPTHATGGIYVTSDATRLVVSWVGVPVYSDSGNGDPQTFQVRLYPDGRIEYAYKTVTTSEAVVGISPGNLTPGTALVDFTAPVQEEYSSTIAERFSGSDAIDIFSAAQKFYLNHEDAYDYIVVYNAMGIPAGNGVVAFEVTTRNDRSGYGDDTVDIGLEAGSHRRLQSILNMGPLNQYPADPNAIVPARATSRDTALTVLGHEAGHLFLAFATVSNPDNPDDKPMLGRSFVHWNFAFNSEASLLEGNRIRDNGLNASPRFTTTGTVEGYAPLDQYLMGFLPPEQVPDTFYVENPSTTAGGRSPQIGVNFNGRRVNVSINDIIQAEGRRTPDYTVSQRHFRFGFVLVTPAGVPPSAAQIAQIDTYRKNFETAYTRFTGGNAYADTTLLHAVQLSSAPAAGVLVGGTGTGTLSLDAPASSDAVFALRSQSGAVTVPSSVTIPAGALSAVFQITGVRVGTDDLTAQPANPSFETAYAKIQVDAASDVKIAVVSGDAQSGNAGVPLANPVVFKVIDGNQLPDSGVGVRVAMTGGGSVDRNFATTDENGTVSFRWTPGSEPINELKVTTVGGSFAVATVKAKPNFAATDVVNAASYVAGMTPGGIATLFGTNLSGATISVGGTPTTVFYSDSKQLNFLVPATTPVGSADVTITTSGGSFGPVSVPVVAFSPGVFFDSASGYGAILIANTSSVTQVRPAGAGDYVEIYGTGFGSGPVIGVKIAGVDAEVVFAGQTPSFPGLFQIDAKVPAALPSGAQSLLVTQNGVSSNPVKIQLK